MESKTLEPTINLFSLNHHIFKIFIYMLLWFLQQSYICLCLRKAIIHPFLSHSDVDSISQTNLKFHCKLTNKFKVTPRANVNKFQNISNNTDSAYIRHVNN